MSVLVSASRMRTRGLPRAARRPWRIWAMGLVGRILRSFFLADQALCAGSAGTATRGGRNTVSSS